MSNRPTTIRAISQGLCLWLAASLSSARAETIDALLSQKQDQVAQSVLVVRLRDGKTLYEKNPSQLVSPASVTKLITSAATLSKFSPVHTFKTRFYYTGQRRNDRILGDLIVEGDGDPFLVSEKLWQLAADIKNMGIREFSGDLVIDNSLFDSDSRDASRLGGLKSSSVAYDAPISAFAVNFNTFAIAIAPGDASNKSASVNFDPYPLRGVVLQNNVRTGTKASPKSLDVKRSGLGGGHEKLVASGSIPSGAAMAKIYRAVGDPLSASGEYLQAFLRASGVVVAGKIRNGRRPAESTPLIELESYEMRKIVAGLNTFSNNFIADMLVKRLGAAFPKTGEAETAGQGTYDNGLAVIRDFLKREVGIKSEFVLENGSGLATENRLSARQIVDVLAYMEAHMEVFPEFLASLPASGWDGTLRHRFSKGEASEVHGLYRAKTGTLSEPISVVSLAGYFRHPQHGLTAFCILENGKSGKPQPDIGGLRARQDQVLAAFMQAL